MKKSLHILILFLGGSLAAAIVFAILIPTPRRPLPVSGPGPSPAGPPARAVLLLGSSPASASETWSRSEFGFGEKIFATAVIAGVEPGDHVLTFRWFSPRGGLQETFRKPFSSRGGDYRAWSWLELRGEEWLGLPLGRLGPGRFLGRWRVEAELDGVSLGRAIFSVR